MLKTIRIFAIACISSLSLASLAGCAADATQSNEQTSSSASDVTKKKYHYVPGVSDATWFAGCGPVHPQGAPCATPQIRVTYTPDYVDLQTTSSVRVDNDDQIITIKLDTWSTSQIHSHMMTEPHELDIDAPAGLAPGADYLIIVTGYDGAILFTGDITITLAA